MTLEGRTTLGDTIQWAANRMRVLRAGIRNSDRTTVGTVLDEFADKFGEDFADNKKALDQVSIVRSKGLKNEIAGYITKFIKKEIREEKAKQARIAASKDEQQVEAEQVIELTEDVVVEGGVEIVEATETVVEATTEEVSSDTVEEKTE